MRSIGICSAISRKWGGLEFKLQLTTNTNNCIIWAFDLCKSRWLWVTLNHQTYIHSAKRKNASNSLSVQRSAHDSSTNVTQQGIRMTAEFDSWYEDSFLGGVANGDVQQIGSTTNVPSGKSQPVDKPDTCVCQLWLFQQHYVPYLSNFKNGLEFGLCSVCWDVVETGRGRPGKVWSDAEGVADGKSRVDGVL